MGALPFCHLVIVGKIHKPGFPIEVKTLGDAIRKRRLELGIRQIELAEVIGCDEMSIVNWEKNYTEPRITHMAAIMRFLGYFPFPKCDNMAQRLVNHRKARGLTQKGFAAELGVDPTTLARWERGERELRGLFIQSVLNVLEKQYIGSI